MKSNQNNINKTNLNNPNNNQSNNPKTHSMPSILNVILGIFTIAAIIIKSIINKVDKSDEHYK